jgi:hypothetical protein
MRASLAHACVIPVLILLRAVCADGMDSLEIIGPAAPSVEAVMSSPGGVVDKGGDILVSFANGVLALIARPGSPPCATRKALPVRRR